MHTVLANGANIPAIGFGTWTLRGDQAADLVREALEAGYRHVDTAVMYENEEAVGEGLKAAGVVRDDIFVTTKVWPTDIADGDLQRSVEASLKRLDLDAVDLALIHWPSKTVPLAESFKALNEVLDRGLCRHIGVSNFTVAMIEDAVALSRHPLACNQVEYHPFVNQAVVHQACRKHGMAMVAYCPLNRAGVTFAQAPVRAAVEAHNRTPAQVVLRWHMQQDGVVAIPRTTNGQRMRENLELFDFQLSDDEMAAISSLTSRNQRQCDFDFSPEWDPAPA